MMQTNTTQEISPNQAANIRGFLEYITAKLPAMKQAAHEIALLAEQAGDKSPIGWMDESRYLPFNEAWGEVIRPAQNVETLIGKLEADLRKAPERAITPPLKEDLKILMLFGRSLSASIGAIMRATDDQVRNFASTDYVRLVDSIKDLDETIADPMYKFKPDIFDNPDYSAKPKPDLLSKATPKGIGLAALFTGLAVNAIVFLAPARDKPLEMPGVGTVQPLTKTTRDVFGYGFGTVLMAVGGGMLVLQRRRNAAAPDAGAPNPSPQ